MQTEGNTLRDLGVCGTLKRQQQKLTYYSRKTWKMKKEGELYLQEEIKLWYIVTFL